MQEQPDYFALLSLPRTFGIDLAALEKAYFALQQQYHPDRFSARPAAERAEAMQKAASINDAYRLLKSPRLRAEYLLSLNGHDINKTKPDQATLMENIEMQEQFEEARSDAAMGVLAASAQAAQDECISGLEAAFAKADYARAAQLALRLSYVSKLFENIRQKRFLISNPAA